MGRIYEALTRANRNDRVPAGSAEDGQSVRTAVDAMATIASTVNQPLVEPPVPGTSVEQSEASPRRQVQPARRRFSSQPGVASNGFRHITVPLLEESRLAYTTEPHGMSAEQFRFVRRTLTEEFPQGGVLMITSPAPRDGKTFTTLNLCSCLADGGRPTLLAEVDIRQPMVRKTLACSVGTAGIEEVLTGRAAPTDAVQFIENLAFHAAMVKEAPEHPSRLIGGEGLRQFLAWAREQFHWVVLDAPPVLPASDVAELLPLADAVVLVIRAQKTPRELSKRAIEMLHTRLYGVILNEGSPDTNPYYRYLHQYYGAPQGKNGKKP